MQQRDLLIWKMCHLMNEIFLLIFTRNVQEITVVVNGKGLGDERRDKGVPKEEKG